MFQDENEWLREELGDTERRLEEALASLATVQEEKKQWLFMEEVGQDNLTTLKKIWVKETKYDFLK